MVRLEKLARGVSYIHNFPDSAVIYSRRELLHKYTLTAYKTQDVRAMLRKFIINTYAGALSRVARRCATLLEYTSLYATVPL